MENMSDAFRPGIKPGHEKNNPVLCEQEGKAGEGNYYARGIVTDKRKDQVTAELEPEYDGGRKQTFVGEASQCVLAYSEVELQTDNLVSLPILSDEAIVDALRWRFMKAQIFSHCGSVLISINPFRDIESFSDRALERFEQGQEDPTVPHIFNTCLKARKMQSIRGRSQAFVLSGESGSGKTEMARNIMRIFSARSSDAKSDPQGAALKNLTTILEAFGNAVTVNNTNASRFGRLTQFAPEGVGLIACSCTPLLFEQSRVSRRRTSKSGEIRETERNFHVFYQLLAGISKEQKEELGLQSIEQYAEGYLFGATTVKGVNDSEQFSKLLPALMGIGVEGSLKDDLWRCLSGILSCGNIEFAEDKCTNPASMKLVAKCLGVASGNLEKELIGDTPETSQSRTDSFAQALYGEVFSWLVRRASELMTDIPSDRSWVGILDLPGFERIGEDNKLDQLLLNHAEERLQQFFSAKIIDVEYNALANEDGIDMQGITLTDNSQVVDLLEGNGIAKGVFTLLAKESDNMQGSDNEFAYACNSSLAGKPSFSGGTGSTAGFAVAHSFSSASVQYSTAGFCETNKASLEPPMLKILAESSSPLIREVAAAAKGSKNRGLRADRFCKELNQVLNQLGDGSTDLHFVKCILSNRTGKTCKEQGSFDWQCVMQQCRGQGIFQIHRLRQDIAQFPCRISHSEFLADFAGLAIEIWGSLQKKGTEAIDTILKKEVPEFLAQNQVRVGSELVLMSIECLARLKEKLDKPEKNLAAVAELVQRVARGHSAGTQVAVAQQRLVSLQSCMRRRIVMQKELSKRAAQRQFYGVVRLLQAVDQFKAKRKSSLVIAAYFRTVVSRQQYKDTLEQRRAQTLASLVAGCWKVSRARQELDDIQTAGQDSDTVSSFLESFSLRIQLARKITDNSTIKLQSLRRGLVGQREVEGMKADRSALAMLQTLMDCVFVRKKMVKELVDKSALGMQSVFRGARGRAEAQSKAEARSDLQTLTGAFHTCIHRFRVVKALTDRSIVVLQKDRRQVVATQTVRAKREDLKSQGIVSGVFATLLARNQMENSRTTKSVTALQGMFRGKVGRRKVEKIKVDRADWNIFTSMIQTLRHREEINMRRSQAAAFLLQNHIRGYLARKRVIHIRFVHLQRCLSGVYHRQQARAFLQKEQERAWLNLNIRRVCSAVQAVACRRQHVQRLEYEAAQTLQRTTRGMISRTRVRQLRIIHSQKTILGKLRSFQAKGQLRKIIAGSTAQHLSLLILSKFQTAHIRARLHMFKQHVKATSRIQRATRGWLARKWYKSVKWAKKAVKAKKILHGMMKRFHSIAYVYEERHDSHLNSMNTVYHCLVQTLMERIKLHDYSKKLYLGAAALKIQKVYRGWSCRRRPGVRMIKQAIDRVQLETRDRNMQTGHAAAALIQAIWRSWIARQVHLLPKVMSHLALERNLIFEAKQEDVSSLSNFGYSANVEGIARVSAGGSLIVNMTVNYYGDLRRQSFRCFGEFVQQIEQRGEAVIDMGIGKQHATASCQSGALYAYYQPDAFTFYDADPNQSAFVLTPLPFREALRDPAPRITHVSCGERHTLMMSDEGLLFTWGMNNRGQCGVGKHLPQQAYFSATCLQRWAIQRTGGVQPPASAEGWSKLPRVKAIACGHNHSACVDAKGSLWLWGEHQGIGLVNVKSAKADPHGQAPTFLLFRLSRDIHKRHLDLEATRQAEALASSLANAKNSKMGIKQGTKRQQEQRSQANGGDEDYDEFENYDNESEAASTMRKFDSSSPKGVSGVMKEMGSVRAMFMEALESVAIKEVVGDVLAPTKCCNIVLSCISEGARLLAAGTPVLDCYIDGMCAPVFPAPARGSKFIDVGCGPGMNLALSDKGYIFTWGIPEKGLLGRPDNVPTKPSAPERLPFFPQLAISATQISIGRDHVLCLTTHGRVFTWGKVDACLGPSGFQRCTLEEPMYVEGVLREMRVTKVAAGRLESAIATTDFDVVLGWEMLEMSAVGHRLLPVAFQYTFTGPRTGFNQARITRMSMPQSDAVQFLMCGGPTAEVPHLHGMEPYPEDMSSQLGHHFTRRGEGAQKKELDLLRRRQKKPIKTGIAIQELFNWAARVCSSRCFTTTDPRLKRAAAVMVTTSFGARKRDSLEVERDLSGFRRLALSRHDSNVMNIGSDCYRDNDYEVHEELGDFDFFEGDGNMEEDGDGMYGVGGTQPQQPQAPRATEITATEVSGRGSNRGSSLGESAGRRDPLRVSITGGQQGMSPQLLTSRISTQSSGSTALF